MTPMYKPNRCCSSYDNLLPVSVRTETGEWKTMWQCQVCGEYYDITLESVREHAYSHVRITRMERIDPPVYVLQHKALDTVQFRLMQEGVDIFAVERETARLDVVPRDGMCPNCLIDPVTVRTEGGKETYTCRWCGTTYQVKSFPQSTSQEAPFAVFTSETKTPSEPTILSSEHSHTETDASAGVSPTPDTSDTLSTGDDTMARYSDSDALMKELFTDTNAIAPASGAQLDQDDFNHLVDTFLPADETPISPLGEVPVLDIPDMAPPVTVVPSEMVTPPTMDTPKSVRPAPVLLPETKMHMAASTYDLPTVTEATLPAAKKPRLRVTATLLSMASHVHCGDLPVTSTSTTSMTIECAAFSHMGNQVSSVPLASDTVYPVCQRNQDAADRTKALATVRCSFTPNEGDHPVVLHFWNDTQFSVEIVD